MGTLHIHPSTRPSSDNRSFRRIKLILPELLAMERDAVVATMVERRDALDDKSAFSKEVETKKVESAKFVKEFCVEQTA